MQQGITGREKILVGRIDTVPSWVMVEPGKNDGRRPYRMRRIFLLFALMILMIIGLQAISASITWLVRFAKKRNAG
jgi:hypothetical protein